MQQRIKVRREDLGIKVYLNSEILFKYNDEIIKFKDKHKEFYIRLKIKSDTSVYATYIYYKIYKSLSDDSRIKIMDYCFHNEWSVRLFEYPTLDKQISCLLPIEIEYSHIFEFSNLVEVELISSNTLFKKLFNYYKFRDILFKRKLC